MDCPGTPATSPEQSPWPTVFIGGEGNGEVLVVVHPAGFVLAAGNRRAGTLPDRVATAATVPGRRNCRIGRAGPGVGGHYAAGLGPARHLASAALNSAPAADQLDQENDDCEHEQYVDEPAQGVRGHEPEQP